MRLKQLAAMLLLTGLFIQCQAQTTVNFNDQHIHYMGRVAMLDSAAVISWPGTTLSINFTGTSAKAVLNDERADNSFNVIVDGQIVSQLLPSVGKKEYVLASGLSEGKHHLELFKRTEWENGKTWFYNFSVDGKILAAPKTHQHKIEYFGDSITAGYAVEDSTGQDRGTGQFKNNYKSYASITARHFDAEYYCTVKSGIGIMISWFPLVMPEMYNRLDATDPNSRWDFSKYTPDIVVVNLFQNDSWLTQQPNNEQFKGKFGTTPPTGQQIIAAYASFIKTLRTTYPKAHIICALGNMDATQTGKPWTGYIDKAVASLGDKNIYTHYFPCKNTPGHPNPKEQQAMADSLITYIHDTFGW